MGGFSRIGGYLDSFWSWWECALCSWSLGTSTKEILWVFLVEELKRLLRLVEMIRQLWIIVGAGATIRVGLHKRRRHTKWENHVFQLRMHFQVWEYPYLSYLWKLIFELYLYCMLLMWIPTQHRILTLIYICTRILMLI